MRLSLIIPMYNESSVIEQSAQTLQNALDRDFGKENYELLFVDDGSKDGCSQLIRSDEEHQVRVIRYEENRGKGYAVRMGMLAANGDIVMFTDADLAYGTEVVLRAAEMLCKQTDADVLVGSRNLKKDGYEGYSFFRKVASKAYIRVLCMIGGLKLSDSQCGCKAFRKDAAQKIFSNCEVDRFAFDFEAILWAQKFGYHFIEMPVKVINHRESTVHVFKDSFRMLHDLRKMKKRIRKAIIE